MKKLIPIIICILILTCGCTKAEPLTFDNAEAYAVDFSDNSIVLHPKNTPPKTLITIEIDTTSMDIVENDAFIISGTATPNKSGYTMDKSCIVLQKFNADHLDIVDEVLYTESDFIIVNTSRRNIKIYCNGNAFSVFDIVSVKGSADKIEPLAVSRPDDSDLVVTYQMKNATVSLITE